MGHAKYFGHGQIWFKCGSGRRSMILAQPRQVLVLLLTRNSTYTPSKINRSSNTPPMATEIDLPQNVLQLLPGDDISITNFLAWSLPPCASINTHYTHVEKYLSPLDPNVDRVNDVLAILSPPNAVVNILADRIQDPSVKSIQCPHLENAGGQQFPIWIVAFWKKLLFMRDAQMKWRAAHYELVAQLRLKPDDQLLSHVLSTLSHVPWTGRLCGFRNSIDIHKLWVFLSKEWLSDDHLLVMLDLLQEDITAEHQNQIFIENTHFMNKLTAAYHERTQYTSARSFRWVREHGQQLAAGQKTHLATIVNKSNVHWVALIIDFARGQILYGDSAGQPIDKEITDVLGWWTSYHTGGSKFPVAGLDITIQHDSYSCGMFAWDALRYELSNHSTERLHPAHASVDRLQMFLRLVRHYHNQSVSYNK